MRRREERGSHEEKMEIIYHWKLDRVLCLLTFCHEKEARASVTCAREADDEDGINNRKDVMAH